MRVPSTGLGSLFLATLFVVPGCRTARESVMGLGRDDRPSPRPLTREEKAEAGRLLQRTALFRKNGAHPDWEKWAARDLRLLATGEAKSSGEWPLWEIEVPLRSVAYVHRRDAEAFFAFTFDDDGRTVRDYMNNYVRRAIERDLAAGNDPEPKLTPEQAVTRAKAYVAGVLGGFPDDLRLESVRYVRPQEAREGQDGAPPPPEGRWMTPEAAIERIKGYGETGLYDYEWAVRFYRYAGHMRYISQELVIRFSERYGVERYFNKCYDRWDGKVAVTADEAEAIAARANIGDYVWRFPRTVRYPRDTYRLAVLQPRVRGKHPFLIHVLTDKPKEVHAVWIVDVPYDWVLADGSEEPQESFKTEALVDAETGEFICCVE